MSNPRGLWEDLNEKTGHPEYNRTGCTLMWIAWVCVICGLLAGMGVLLFLLVKTVLGG